MVDGSFPASRAPSSNFPNSIEIFSSGAPTVIRPSTCRPARLAVTGPAVATRISGATSGIVQSRVDSNVKYLPSCLVSLPASDAENSLLIISMASNSRLMRSGASGQYWPTMCSFNASPDPNPSQCRPGYIAAKVALA